ncbi:unnamed protein product [Nyctereutes procyonoides]|uniref:(raccoon dog) hypothetical protein n=1 Tax=Nyctereutes procyonoides TaxID=34880 RepID=A0A811YH23_NYCPR|nr:unnamed protein product [Nyctereutes procyonoides]
MPGGIMSKTPALLNYPAFAVTETLWLRDPGGLKWPMNLGSAACGSQGLESGPVDASSPFPAVALKGICLVTCYLGVSKHRTEFREYSADFCTPVV